MSRWYQGEGKNSDVVLYSKIRLARNLEDYPFSNRMNDEIRRTVTKKIYATVKSSSLANEFDIINLSEISNPKAVSYAEKELISAEFLKNKNNGSFLLSENEDVSVMVCEEDHIRISAFSPGQSLDEAYAKADKIDDVFIKSFKLAYNDRLGFLTASVANLGTGMKASYALHLPALAGENSVYRISSMASKLGLTLRPLYKNGAGDIYILSNRVSLGISEKNAIENLSSICDRIVEQERKERENLKEDFETEDKIYRNLGIMKTARKLNTQEFLDCLSMLRLGIELGIIKDIDYKTVGDFIYNLQDASIIAYANKQLDETTCEKARAEVVRNKLQNKSE